MTAALVLAAVLAAAPAAAQSPPVVTAQTYALAERLRAEAAAALSFDTDMRPTWIPGSHALWFRTADEDGTRFRIAEAGGGPARPAFEAGRLAVALSKALGKPVQPLALPIAELDFPRGPSGPLRVKVGAAWYACDLAAPVCDAEPTDAPDRLYAPGRRYAVFAKGPNLWVKDLATGAERALTTDGVTHDGYGTSAEGFAFITRARAHLTPPPVGDFSPDGKTFVTYRLDETRLPVTHVLQAIPDDGSDLPKLWSYPKAGPADRPSAGAMMAFDLATRAVARFDHPPSPVWLTSPIAFEKTAWSADGRAYYFVDYAQDLKTRTLFRTDVATGATTALVTDRSDASLFDALWPGFRLLKDGRIVWASEREGTQQLYLFDARGRLERRLTDGRSIVREIVRVDEGGRWIAFTEAGRHAGEDPYLRHLARVGLDARGLRELTPEPADHEVVTAPRAYFVRNPPGYGGYSDDGRFFVDAFSRVDLPTSTVVRSGPDGKVVATLATARLSAAGRELYTPPEPFQALAEDGVTPVYGVVITPKGFDPSRRYPVIDAIYDGPQQPTAPKRFMWDAIDMDIERSLAELGFVVVNMDGRGKPLRSRAFWRYGYGRLGRGGLPDHVAALRQLAAKRPYMDLDRGVGAFGFSAGGFAVVHALFDHPDVYKVGVAVSPYSMMLEDWNWAQQFQGPYDRADSLAQEPWTHAAAFDGKLLLAVGDVDDIVHPASTLRIVDALIKANRPVDMLVVPGGDHQLVSSPWMQVRTWDYFVRNVLGAEPPKGYRIGAAAAP